MSFLSLLLSIQLILLQARTYKSECMLGNAGNNARWIDHNGYFKNLSKTDCSRIREVKYSENVTCLNELDIESIGNCSCTFLHTDSDGIYSCSGDSINFVPNLTRHASNNEIRLYCLTNAKNVNGIRSHQFVGARIREMQIMNLGTLRLEDHAFNGINSLEVLTLKYNTLGQLGKPGLVFAGLSNLTTLDLSFNNITTWDTSDNDTEDDKAPVLPKLKTLDLSGNPMVHLNNETFKWLKGSQLQHLYLKKCHIKYIMPGSLKPVAPTLYAIDLGSSVIPHSFISNLVSGLKSIQGLGLAKIGLTDVPYDVLQIANTTLQYLSLHGNLIRVLDPHIMTKMAQKVRNEVFPYLPALEELDMRDCSIYHIEENTFSKMPKLKTLLLSNNQVGNSSSLSSLSLPELNYLDLSYNSIEMENFNFSGYPSLQVLDLSYTNSHYLDENTFLSENKSITLKQLSMCNTKLKNIQKGSFKYFTQLEALDLSGNTELGQSLTADSFEGLKSLEELHFSECNIHIPLATNIPDESKEPEIMPLLSLTNIKRLNLSKNDIRAIPNKTIHHLKELESLDLRNNFIISWNEHVFVGSSVKSLNVGHNYLNYITDAMLADFKNLTTLIISNNPFVCDYNCVLFWNMVNSSTENTGTKIYDIGYIEPRSNVYNTTPKLLQSKSSYTVIETKSGFRALYPENENSDRFTSEWNDNEKYQCIDKSSHNTVNLMNFQDVWQLYINSIKERNDTYSGLGVVEKEGSETVAITVVAVALLVITFGGITYWKWWYIRHFAVLVKNATILSFMANEEDDSLNNKIFTYDVFVSYCDRNREWVLNNLLTNLESKSDLKVCLHERDFQVGIGILENIIASMDQSRCILLVISQQFLQSQWCQFELHLAQHRLLETRREELILLFLENIPKIKRPKTLQYLMKTKTYIQWPEKFEDEDAKKLFWKRLHNAVLRNSIEMDKKFISMA